MEAFWRKGSRGSQVTKTKKYFWLVALLVVGGVGGILFLPATGIFEAGHFESRLLIFVGLCLVGLTNGNWK